MERTSYRAGTTSILILAASALSFCLPSNPHEQHEGKPIVVELQRKDGKLAFTLEPNPAPDKDILWGLNALVKQRGADYPVVALVDDGAAIRDLDQVPGIAAKPASIPFEFLL